MEDSAWLPTPRSWDKIVLAAGVAMLAWLFWANTMAASLVVDGTRYFWLDDDMMISMRYGRNLAEGHGLAWNPGDRVEGYTNFGWTLIMAAVHLAKPSDAHAAVVMKAINFVLASASLFVGLRMLRLFVPRSLLAAAVFMVCFVTCPDILFWSVWGFETTLVTFVSLLFLWRIFSGKDDVVAFLVLALLPLCRGDGVHVFAAHALVALVLSKNRRRTLVSVAIAFLPALAHLAFRRVYYGAWVPNTYDLKVYLVPDIHRRGYGYVRAFALRYPALLVLAAGSGLALIRRDRRAVALFVCVLGTVGYAWLAGGDLFGGFRFFGHVMPLVFVFAVSGVDAIVRGAIPRATWCGLLFVLNVPLLDPLKRLVVADDNGDPDRQLRVALIMKKHALPTSSAAVLCAGIVPYFSRLRALDLAGKSDRHIARLPAVPDAMIGHGKVDPDYTLGQNPDFVVACSNGNSFLQTYPVTTKTADPLYRFIIAPSFQTRYLPFPVIHSYLLSQTSVYTHRGSPEFPRRTWAPD